MSGWIPAGTTTSDEESRAFESAVSDLSDDEANDNDTYGSFDSLPPAERATKYPNEVQVVVRRKAERSPLLNPSRPGTSQGLDNAGALRSSDEFFYSPTVSPVTPPDIQDSLENGQMNVPRPEDERKSYMITLPDVNSIENGSTCFSLHVMSILAGSKIYLLFLLTLALSILFAIHGQETEDWRMTSVSASHPDYLKITNHGKIKVIRLSIKGPFPPSDQEDLNYVDNVTATFFVGSEKQVWCKMILNGSGLREVEKDLQTVSKKFQFEDLESKEMNLNLTSSTHQPVAVSFMYEIIPLTKEDQVIIAFIILVGVYLLIIFELTHRATAAMLGGLAGLAALSSIKERPSLEDVIGWLEFETLSLLFGMMTLVAVFAETGFFDFVALKAYKYSRGRVWLLIYLLCAVTGIISAFLDNVTTILLFTPVTIRLCQVLNINPKYVLIAEVLFSNIGGTATAIGDPPNVIIVSTKAIMDAELDFKELTSHLSFGILFCFVLAFPALRLLYYGISLDNPDPPEIAELKREAEIWKRTADRVTIFSPEEKTVKLLLVQKYMVIENTIRRMTYRKPAEKSWRENLSEMEKRYVITDKGLLIKTSLILAVVIILFFVHSTINLDIGWIALMGAIALITLADIKDVERVFVQVEWTTLIFFAGLFVLMESLSKLGLISFIGNTAGGAIEDVNADKRLLVAIVIIIWVSALASAFIDNIPFTTAMIPVIVSLHENDKYNLPLKPMIYALAMGACLGGNGTLVGASANVVCTGIAEQHGCKISFNSFTKIGFPMMLMTTVIAMTYLIFCHYIFSWGNV